MPGGSAGPPEGTAAAGPVVKVRELTSTDLVTVGPEDSVRAAIELLTARRIGGAVVVAGGRAVGVVSATDILEFEAATPGVPAAEWDVLSEHTVSEVMTHALHTIEADADVASAADAMMRAGIHRLLVTENGRLTGIVTTTDIVRAVACRRIGA